MISNLLINSDGNGRAAISGNASDSCTVDRFGAGTFRADDAALFIQGLAILSPTTELASQSVWDLRKTAVHNTLTTNAMCNATNGIINIGNGQGSGSLVHGLGTLFRRNTTASALRNYVKKYLSVQYNAVVDQTTTSGTNIYGASWQGPPSSNYSVANQTLAIHALLSAMVLPDPQTTSDNSDDGDDGNGGGDSPNLAGIIAGSVVGALALLGIIVAAVFVVRRRERRRKDAYNNDFFVDDITPPEPFTIPMMTSTTAPLSGNAQNDIPSVMPVTATTLATHNEKSRLNHTLAWEGPSSTGSRSDVPSTLSDLMVPSRSDSRDIPTDELVRLLHDRLQRGELADSTAPPAYDDPAHPR
ncbi:hypothetical protein BDZ89DRAFT_777888 [Hymenopellis radicata]|nr:hypothetical protein BDZ89DRAFT_777888 [Hymenopellis radicata]